MSPNSKKRRSSVMPMTSWNPSYNPPLSKIHRKITSGITWSISSQNGIRGTSIFVQHGVPQVPMRFQNISKSGLPGWNMPEMTNLIWHICGTPASGGDLSGSYLGRMHGGNEDQSSLSAGDLGELRNYFQNLLL